MIQKPEYSLEPSSTVFLIVDPQRAFGEVIPVPKYLETLDNIKRASHAWKGRGGQVYITRHLYAKGDQVGRIADFIPGIGQVLQPGSPHAEFHDGISGDVVIQKSRFNALIGTDLKDQILSAGARTVIICGYTTPICVGCTVDALSQSDFQVVVLEDACASQPFGGVSAEEAHRVAIERMGYVFAQTISTEDFLAKLTKSVSAELAK